MESREVILKAISPHNVVAPSRSAGWNETAMGVMHMRELGWGLGRHVIGSNVFYYIRDLWGSFGEYYFDLGYIPEGYTWKPLAFPNQDGSTASCKDLGSQGEEISFETITEWIAPTKTQEQRAAMNLSRPWWHQGKRQDARQLLAEFYGRLTEGIGTADL